MTQPETANETTATSPTPNPNGISRPSIVRDIELNSLQAQRVFDRYTGPLSRSLFSLDVILRITTKREEIDVIEHTVLDMIAVIEKEVNEEYERIMNELRKDEINLPAYTNPQKRTIEIQSPTMTRYVRLVVLLDKLIHAFDTLWLYGGMANASHTERLHAWPRRIQRLGGRIIEIEKRARISAQNAGKQEEVDKALEAAGQPTSADEIPPIEESRPIAAAA